MPPQRRGNTFVTVAALQSLIADHDPAGAATPPPLWPIVMHGSFVDPLADFDAVNHDGMPPLEHVDSYVYMACTPRFALEGMRRIARILRQRPLPDCLLDVFAHHACSTTPRPSRLLDMLDSYVHQPRDMPVRFNAMAVLVDAVAAPELRAESPHPQQLFVACLESPDWGVCEAAVRLVMQCIGSDVRLRNTMLADVGVLPLLLAAAATHPGTWAELARFFGWLYRDPPQDAALLAPVMPALTAMLGDAGTDAVRDVMLAIQSIVAEHAGAAAVCAYAPLVAAVLANLFDSDESVAHQALRAATRMLAVDPAVLDDVVQSGGLRGFQAQLQGDNGAAYATCRMLSRLCAVSPTSAKAVIDAQLMPLVFARCCGGNYRPVRAHAVEMVCNACCHGAAADVAYLIDIGAVQVVTEALRGFCHPLAVHPGNAALVLHLLKAADALLVYGHGVAHAMRADGAVPTLRALQHHRSPNIRETSTALLDGHFRTDPEEEEHPPHASAVTRHRSEDGVGGGDVAA